MEISIKQLKKLAKNAFDTFNCDKELKYSAILELFAKTLGFKDFNALSAKSDGKSSRTVTLEINLVYTHPTQQELKAFSEDIDESLDFCAELFSEIRAKIFDPFLDEALLIKNTLYEQHEFRDNPSIRKGTNYSLDMLLETHYKKLSPEYARFVQTCIKQNCLFENTELLQNAYEIKTTVL